jgi:hypothetical protein
MGKSNKKVQVKGWLLKDSLSCLSPQHLMGRPEGPRKLGPDWHSEELQYKDISNRQYLYLLNNTFLIHHPEDAEGGQGQRR